MIDREDVLECRARLGVIAAAVLEQAHEHCVDLQAMKSPDSADALTGLADDFSTLVAAMAVVARRAG